ncbi:MAG: YfhO family protein [Saprospiraceae bacterium]
MNSFVKKALIHIAVLVAFLAVAALYFAPQLQGKVLPQGDIVQYQGMSHESRVYEEKTGRKMLWTNAMFGGMPTYQINTVDSGNHLKKVEAFALLGMGEPIGRFFVAMVCFYILMVCLRVNPLLGAVGSVAFALSTNNLILLEAGHMTKLAAISHLPLVAAGMLLAFRKQYLAGGILFALGMGLDIYSNHVQMTYYFALTLLIYGIAQLIYSIRENELTNFAIAAGVLILAGGAAAASAASNLLVTYEYSRDTMRGKPILQPDANADKETNSSAVEGLAWDYAMQWSNNTLDLFAAVIPGVVGGGSQEPLGKNSKTAQALRNRGVNPAALEDLKLPLYWGALPFTSGPIYFGATVFFFFLMGLFLVKGPAKWWLALGTLLTFMLSMGKNLEWFNRLIFEYLPLYNKFRTPNSVLSIASFLIPALGFLALCEALKNNSDENRIRRALYISAGIMGAITLFFILIGPSMFSFRGSGDDQLTQAGFDINTIIADRKGLMRGDALRSLVLVLLSGGLLWAYLQKMINKTIVIAGLGVLVLFDLWGVGRRYVDADSFVAKSNYANNFKPRPVDELILKDSDPNFRVLDLSVNTFNNATSSYFHKTIGGYHPAKLQRYQDIIDRHIANNNEKVLNMLNTKYYIIQNQQTQQLDAQINMPALGNAWFVDNIQMVKTANEEIDALNTFEPASEAIIHQEFSNYIANFDPQKDSSGTIKLLTYEPDHLTYESNASSEQLAVFSEIWYGPNKGWNAYIDGKATEHIRANYILRALRVPAGKHKIEFKFEPQIYKTGTLISNIFSGLIVVGLLGFVGYAGYKGYQKAQNEPKPEPKPKPQPVQPTTSRSTTTTSRPITKSKKKK